MMSQMDVTKTLRPIQAMIICLPMILNTVISGKSLGISGLFWNLFPKNTHHFLLVLHNINHCTGQTGDKHCSAWQYF